MSGTTIEETMEPSPTITTPAPPPSGTSGPAALSHSVPWELRSVEDIASALATDLSAGLSSAEVADRRARFGENALAEPPRRPAWQLFLDQFRSILILVLIGAAVVAGLIGDLKDTIVIGIVLLLNATLGFIQEHRAEKSLAALKSMLSPTARVRRDGRIVEVPASSLVPGDVVHLEAGDRVPADGRLALTASTEIDESTLTGESVPVEKHSTPLDPPEDDDRIAVGDRTNSAFMNTVVTRGRAELLVTETGMHTEIGRLAQLLSETDAGTTPLQEQLHTLGKRLGLVAGAAVSVFFVLGLLRGQSLGDTLLSSVALAVAAIPEGLPAVVTVTLAVGVSQMAKRGAIVKRLASVETLGSTSVICSDKTGTLTLNRMSVEDVVAAPDREQDLLHSALLCNDSRFDGDRLVGDPTEGALLKLALDRGLDDHAVRERFERIAEVPFDPAVKVMATFHADPDDAARAILHAKGAFDVLGPRCLEVPADADEQMEALARRGRRVLALASGSVPRSVVDEHAADPERLLDLAVDLRFGGLVGIVDPPRPEARDAIAVAHAAGIDVKMITGDHAITAAAIAADLGIDGRAVTGADVEAMTEEELREQVGEIGVFARVAPEHKLRIVDALKRNGHVVAMTGDGVNDAPALKRADVGVAMGITGTEVSKEAATMVLTDDNFSTIVKAVEAGRTIYDNIITFVRFQLSTNVGAILSLVGAQVLGMPVPFTAIQVLWVNLIMDGPPAMTMGVDPPRQATMQRAPRARHEQILTGRRFAVLLVNGTVMAVGTLGILAYYDDPARGGTAHALALAFTTFVLFQLFNALCARAERRTVFHRDTFTNPKLWLALAGVLLLQVLAVHVNAVQDIFGTADLKGIDWLVAVAVASSILWVDELRKLVLRLRKA